MSCVSQRNRYIAFKIVSHSRTGNFYKAVKMHYDIFNTIIVHSAANIEHLGRFYPKHNIDKMVVKYSNVLWKGPPRLIKSAFLSPFCAAITGNACVILKKAFRSTSIKNISHKITFCIHKLCLKYHVFHLVCCAIL